MYNTHMKTVSGAFCATYSVIPILWLGISNSDSGLTFKIIDSISGPKVYTWPTPRRVHDEDLFCML